MRTIRYRQIADELRDRVIAGRYGAGRVLPSEADLGQEFDASRVTVRKALEVLRDEGLVAARQGFGWFVAGAPLRQQLAQLGTIEGQLTDSGIHPERRILEFEFARASGHVARGVGHGAGPAGETAQPRRRGALRRRHRVVPSGARPAPVAGGGRAVALLRAPRHPAPRCDADHRRGCCICNERETAARAGRLAGAALRAGHQGCGGPPGAAVRARLPRVPHRVRGGASPRRSHPSPRAASAWSSSPGNTRRFIGPAPFVHPRATSGSRGLPTLPASGTAPVHVPQRRRNPDDAVRTWCRRPQRAGRSDRPAAVPSPGDRPRRRRRRHRLAGQGAWSLGRRPASSRAAPVARWTGAGSRDPRRVQRRARPRQRRADPLGRPGRDRRAGLRRRNAERRRPGDAVRLQLRLHRALRARRRMAAVGEPRVHHADRDVPRLPAWSRPQRPAELQPFVDDRARSPRRQRRAPRPRWREVLRRRRRRQPPDHCQHDVPAHRTGGRHRR